MDDSFRRTFKYLGALTADEIIENLAPEDIRSLSKIFARASRKILQRDIIQAKQRASLDTITLLISRSGIHIVSSPIEDIGYYKRALTVCSPKDKLVGNIGPWITSKFPTCRHCLLLKYPPGE